MSSGLRIFFMFFFIIINYLLGSIPNGLIIGKIAKNIDIREHGSKNIGATNTFRVLGKVYGILAGFLDILKGAIFIIIIKIGLNYNSKFFYDLAFIEIGGHTVHFYPIYGLFAVYGHILSAFLKLKGGKAVATSFGAVFATAPIIGVVGIIIFFLITNATKYVSLGSLMGTLYIAATTFIYYIFFNKEILIVLKFDSKSNFLNNFIEFFCHLFVTLILSITIFVKHKENIKRLINGEEKPFYGTAKKNKE